ncbi:MAG TPA: hypothetical protein VKE93_09835 [Candidatus Angelobacter sp.]|nr:hypothetical protein [Candidatus Angelobacter sp.]
MRELLRDVGLSFCPASVRNIYRPRSPSRVLLAAVLTGALQAFLFFKLFLAGYLSFLALRIRQLEGPFQRMNQTTQAWFMVVLSVEYLLFHPLGLACAYLSLEGLIRFIGGVATSEVVPSLPVVLVFKINDYVRRRKERRAVEPSAAIPDSFEVLADGECLRVAAARPKPHWNISLTIGIRGECYEVEREERGTAPRVYVYILRRAPIGKALRGYEEYDPAAGAKRT